MTRVFISYSRKDKLFAGKITEALNKSDLETWIDWEDIPATADWLDQIQKGIEGSDGFLFLLSPDSIVSPVCRQEVEHAVQNAKRLIPIVVRDVEAGQVPPALAKVNWIYCREQDDFDGAVERTLDAIRTDLAWVEFHRRLQVRALEWERRKDPSFLLRGRDLREAEEQLASVGQKDPRPTDLQRQYTLSSRRGESRSRNLLLGVGMVALVILTLLTIFANNQRILAQNNEASALANATVAENEKQNAQTQEAIALENEAMALENADVALARQLAAQSQLLAGGSGLDMVQSGLLAIESLRRYPTLEGDQALRRNWTLFPRPVVTIQLPGDGNAVSQIAFSPDGKFLVSGSADGTARVWDVLTGQEVSRKEQADPILDVAFSPVSSDDGVRVASCAGNAVLVWDAISGVETARMLHDEAVLAIDFSPDGKWLLSASSDGTSRVWDALTGQEISRMEHAGIVWDAAFSPDGKSVVSGGNDDAIAWDPVTGQELGRMTPAARVFKVAFSPDGRLVASAGEEISYVWEAAGGKVLASARQPGNVLAIAFNPYGDWVASGSTDGTLAVWEANTGLDVARSQHDWTAGNDAAMGMINAIEFSPDGRFVLTASIDGSARIWEARTGVEVTRLAADDYYGADDIIDGFVNTVAFSPDGKLAALGNSQGLIRIWQVDTDKAALSVDRGAYAYSNFALSPDGRSLAYGKDDNAVHIRDLASGLEMDPLPAQDNIVLTVAFSPDGGRMLATYAGGTAQIWDLAARREIVSLRYNNALALSPDGRWVASDEESNAVKVWDAATGAEFTRFPVGDRIQSLAFSPDGERVAVAISESETNQVGLWDVETGSKLSEIKQPGYITGIAFSPDGKWIVSGSEAGTARVWEAEGGNPIASVDQEGVVYDMAFSPDGRYLAVGGGEFFMAGSFGNDGRLRTSHGTLAIWDTVTKQETARITYTEPVESLAFSPDGGRILDSLGYIRDVSSGRAVGRISGGYGAVFSPDGKWIGTGSGSIFEFWIWRPEDLIADLCSRLPRNLTRAEWNLYLENVPYRATCENLPIEPE